MQSAVQFAEKLRHLLVQSKIWLMSQWAEPRSESEGGFYGIMRMSKWMAYCGLVLAVTCQPAVCSIFSGPNIGLGANPYNSGFNHNWVTNLTLVDTADGMKITGSMSATINEPTDVGFISGGYILNAYRPLGDVAGVDLVLIAQQSGTLSFTGPINVTSIYTLTNAGNSCNSAVAGIDTGGNPLVSLSSGSFAAGPGESPCQTTGGFLNLSWAVYYNLPAGGSGTITIDFGNSIISEAVDSAVPEPSTLWLLSAIIPVVLIRRRA